MTNVHNVCLYFEYPLCRWWFRHTVAGDQHRRLGIAIVANALMSWDQDPPERSAFTWGNKKETLQRLQSALHCGSYFRFLVQARVCRVCTSRFLCVFNSYIMFIFSFCNMTGKVCPRSGLHCSWRMRRKWMSTAKRLRLVWSMKHHETKLPWLSRRICSYACMCCICYLRTSLWCQDSDWTDVRIQVSVPGVRDSRFLAVLSTMQVSNCQRNSPSAWCDVFDLFSC